MERSRQHPHTRTEPMTRLRLGANGQVHLRTEIDVPLPAARVWESMRDFNAFTTQDPFHHRMRLDGPADHPGTPLVIEHRWGPFRLERVGRILSWREGVGYSFSDLSTRGKGAGFPHAYAYELTPLGEEACQVSVTVTGRWTARWVPMGLRRLWLLGVMRSLERILRRHLSGLAPTPAHTPKHPHAHTPTLR